MIKTETNHFTLKFMRPTPKNLIRIVKSGTWFVQGFNGLPLYLHNVASNTGWMTKKFTGANYSHFFLLVHKSRAHWYYDELDMAKVGNGYFKRIKTVAQIKALEKKHLREYERAKRRSGNILPEMISRLSLRDLVRLAEKMVVELTMSVSFAHAQEGISFVAEMRLKDILQKRGETHQDIYQLLSSPTDPSFLLESQVLLGRIARSKGKNKQTLIARFLKDYGWIDNNYVRGKELTRAEILQKAKEQKHPVSLKTLQSTKKKKEKLIKQLKFSPQELFVVKTIELCTKWQDNRKKFIMQSLGRFEPVITELAQRLKINPDALKYATPREINFKNLSNRKFISGLKSRYPRSAYYTDRTGIFAYTGKEYAYIEREVVKRNSDKVTELKGAIANKGIARGRVRIIRSIHDILKVEKGEILVAYMTRPEFLPAMQKAAAFVTNEGGITSHAAIVSREMNKPCIIGTKIATEVFQDGDMVEVDANKGVVKKLR